MNMRQHKSWITARQLFPWALVFEGTRLMAREAAAGIVDGDIQRRMNLAALVEDLPDLAPEFKCVKVNGGEVVDVFQTRSEAAALVLKHAKQRKAKLQVVNTSTGELEIFSEEEPEFTLGNVAATA
jgi:hypothetical protein